MKNRIEKLIQVAVLLTLLLCAAKCGGQTVEFVSPFHVVVSPAHGDQKATTDVYHVATRVVLSDTNYA